MTQPCGGCAARARQRANAYANGVMTKYVWQSPDGMEEKTYESEIEAKAKVARKGGGYTARDLPVSPG